MSATHFEFAVPAGAGLLEFDTGGAAPLEDVRFVFGGPQVFYITRIFGTTNSNPDIQFGGVGATPHEATVHFAREPLGWVPSTVFRIVTYNPSGADQRLQLTVMYRG